MKVLIGYDGSACSDAAVADLRRAGLPDDVEARVVSVAGVWPHMPPSAFEPLDPKAAAGMSPAVRKAHALSARAMADARETAAAGEQRVRGWFPRWTVKAEGIGDAPAPGLIRAVEKCRPDLLVVGSHGRSGVGRMFLGSVSQTVLSPAAWSVRIGPCTPADAGPADAPVKLVLGVDGSVDAAAAVSAVASRAWPKGSAVRVVIAMDLPMSMALAGVGAPLGMLPNDPGADAHDWADKTAQAVEQELRDAGLAATSAILEGDPKRVLLQEAEQWGADCIFGGAKGHSRLDRILLGSVSTAVAARAHCTVEVVRQG